MLLREYRVDAAFDEMFLPDEESRRAHYADLYDGLARLTPESFADKSSFAGACYLSEGITFAHDGREQTFPFDLLPRLVATSGTRSTSRGSASGSARWTCFSPTSTGRGASPRRGHPELAGGLLRRLYTGDGGHRATAPPLIPPFAGIDLIRDDAGAWRMLEDNLRTPSGLSYVVQNRAFMRRVFRRHSLPPRGPGGPGPTRSARQA